MARPPDGYRKGSCCICSQLVEPGKRVFESRPTGYNGAKEKWTYCGKCWASHQKACSGSTPYQRSAKEGWVW